MPTWFDELIGELGSSGSNDVDWNQLGGAWEGAVADSAGQNAALQAAYGSVTPEFLNWLQTIPPKDAIEALEAAYSVFCGGRGGLDKLTKLGLPAALLAGLFQKIDCPLTSTIATVVQLADCGYNGATKPSGVLGGF